MDDLFDLCSFTRTIKYIRSSGLCFLFHQRRAGTCTGHPDGNRLHLSRWLWIATSIDGIMVRGSYSLLYFVLSDTSESRALSFAMCLRSRCDLKLETSEIISSCFKKKIGLCLDRNVFRF
jgi:hypothetical protein